MTAPEPMTCEVVRDLAPLFVVDALSADEMTAVREHLAACNQPHEELVELAEASGAWLATAEPAEPSASVKGRIMARAAEDLATGRHPSAIVKGWVAEAAPETPRADVLAPRADVLAPPADVLAPRPAAEVVSLDAFRSRRRALGWVLAVAAAIAILVLGGWNLSLQSDLSSATAYRTGVDQALALAAKPGSLTALIAGSDGSVSGLGVVGADGSVRLAMRGLTATTGSQVYTAWSIGGDGKPVPIGDFTVRSDGVAVATASGASATTGVVLALTLEPKPGDTTPAGPIVAKGVASAPAG